MKIRCSKSTIGSVGALAKALNVPVSLLLQVQSNPSNYYSISSIGKKSGGVRIISDPVKELKIVQRRLVRRFLSKASFPDYLFGSVKDEANPRDFVRNAVFHKTAKQVMAFDIENFFPSVQPGYVKLVFKNVFCVPEEVASLLVALTTLNGGLPQGAPTSSYLANLIFYDVEHKLVAVLRSKGFQYSRLVDDITVSSTKLIGPQQRTFIYDAVRSMLGRKKLLISKKKYQVTNTETHGRKTIVTGLIIERATVKLPKERIKEIGGLVYNLRHQSEVSTTDPSYHDQHGRASGLVALYRRLDPEKSILYRTELRLALPTFDKNKIKKICYLCRRFISFAKAHPHRRVEEGYARKFHNFRHKINVISRTNRPLARNLRNQMLPLKPTRKLSSYYE